MIEAWELSPVPFEKDPQRFKARIRGSEEDLMRVLRSIPATCGRPFVTLAQNFNWAFYVYALNEEKRVQVADVLEKASAAGGTGYPPPLTRAALARAAQKVLSPGASIAPGPARTEPIEAPPADLDPRLTFSTWVMHSVNRFAQTAALAVSESPGKVHNPLILHGGPGLGKTHLAQAIAQSVASRNPSARVVFLSGSAFARAGDPGWKPDLLCVDDFQDLAQSKPAQEPFLRLLARLRAAGKQVVIAADRPPRLLDLDAPLRAALDAGLAVELKAPSLEVRAAVLKRKSSVLQIALGDDEILSLAKMITLSGFRDLDKALRNVHAQLPAAAPIESALPREAPAPSDPTGAESVASSQPPPRPEPPPEAAAPPAQSKMQPSAPFPEAVPQANARTKMPPEPPAEIDPTLKSMAIACFYPKGRQSDYAIVKQKFNVILARHKLKIRFGRIEEKPYECEGRIDYAFFARECKAAECSIALVLGPPPGPAIAEGDFAKSIKGSLEAERISAQLIPWTEISRDASYLNCALDLSLLCRKKS